LGGFIRKADTMLRMKPISHRHVPEKDIIKKLKRAVKGTTPSLREVPVKVHRNDPLAIGIEELEQSFWPRSRGRRLVD
jgi:hypothetical protein